MAEIKALLDFLEESYPGMKANVARCEKLGFPWASRAFVKKEKEAIISHVGFLVYPILIEGTWHQAGALHAICTKASHRGQGLASELIQEALNWAKDRYEFVVLYTEIPKFYEKMSFHSIQEFRFHLPCKKSKGTHSLTPLVSPKDDALFRRCFQDQAPLSNRLWVKDNGTIASYNTLFATYPHFWSLHYSPSLDAIISYQIEDKTLHLYDIIAKKIPSLESILDHMPSDIDEIYFYFSPDRLTNDAVADPAFYHKNFSGYLMVHGNWPILEPFMIPPLSRC